MTHAFKSEVVVQNICHSFYTLTKEKEVEILMNEIFLT
jgi:hypothetical protein